MRPDRVVLLQPLIDDDFGFCQRTEKATIQASCSKDRIEALAIPVLPRTTGINVMSIDVLFLEPFLDML